MLGRVGGGGVAGGEERWGNTKEKMTLERENLTRLKAIHKGVLRRIEHATRNTAAAPLGCDDLSACECSPGSCRRAQAIAEPVGKVRMDW